MRNAFILLVIGITLAGALAGPPASEAASMGDYCVIPPYVKTDTSPNVMLLIDNSYINGSFAYGVPGDFLAENNYNTFASEPDKGPLFGRYEGYFNPEVMYSYGSNRFEPDNGTTMDPDGDGKPGAFDGSMLNWAATSRYDLLVSILIGGKGTPRVDSNTLVTMNSSWLNTSGFEQDAWPIKAYHYFNLDPATWYPRTRLDTGAYAGLSARHKCLTTVNMKGGGDLWFMDDLDPATNPEGYLCGLIMTPAKGPGPNWSYATAFAGPGPEDAPVMYADAGPPMEPAPGEAPLVYADAGSLPVPAPGEAPLIYVDAGPPLWPVTAHGAPGSIEPLPEGMLAEAREFGQRLLQGLGPASAQAAQPLKIAKPNKDPYVVEISSDYPWEFVLEATGGVPYTGTPYAYWWRKTAENPADAKFTVEPIYEDTDGDGTIDNHYWVLRYPADPGANKTYTVEVEVRDSATTLVYTHFEITVSSTYTPPTGEKNYTVKTCAGNYADNCLTRADDLKRGIVSDFWEQARFGIVNFKGVASPDESYCPEARTLPMDPDFGNELQNAGFVGTTLIHTRLPDGMYEAVLAYMGQNSGSVCDPFEDDDLPCRKNFILLLSAGEGVTDSTWTDRFWPLPAECQTLGANHLARNACYAKYTDLRSETVGVSNLPGDQHVTTYVVNTMGRNAAKNGMLKQTAEATEGNYYEVTDPRELKSQLIMAFQDIIKRAASGTAASVLASGEGSGANLIQAIYYPRRRFFDSSNDSYKEIAWIGRLSNFWYYVDPYFTSSNIREERWTAGDIYPTMDLGEDYVIEMFFDPSDSTVKAYRFEDTNEDGEIDDSTTPVDTVPPAFESLGNIWEAGLKLWNTPAGDRRIYTSDITGSGSSTGLISFTNSTAFVNSGTVQWYLDAADADEARDIVEFVMGYETDYCRVQDGTSSVPCRSRTVKVDVNMDGDTEDTNVTIANSPSMGVFDETVPKVWKLGDVLNSTPTLATKVAPHAYHEDYPLVESTYGPYITNSSYQEGRGMAYTGSNDGMLHAFRLGILNDLDGVNGRHIELQGSGLGREEWAFIPTDALPYLKYQRFPEYCHIYTVDLSPVILDLSIMNTTTGLPDHTMRKTEESWRTILIGGMRFGGACKNMGSAPTEDLDGDGDVDADDIVATPIDGVGYSSYFALDITESSLINTAVSTPPTLLWEFTRPDLGYATTGPAIGRVSPMTEGFDTEGNPTRTYDPIANGYWYVVVGSGPTGPIDKTGRQFIGASDQELKFFVFDAYEGPDAGVTEIPTGIQDAYASSMYYISFDVNFLSDAFLDTTDYSDEMMYIGYVKKCTATRSAEPGCLEGEWNDGGIGRLYVNADPNPSNWEFSKLMDDTGPVTAATAKGIHTGTNTAWVFAATGRYYFVRPDPSITNSPAMPDDHATVRHIVGFMDPCYLTGENKYKDTCSGETVATTDLLDVTLLPDGWNQTTDPGFQGWYISMDAPDYPSGGPYAAERVITDLVTTDQGVLFATSFKPYTDQCSVGGKSHLWAMEVASGGSAQALLKGVAVMQVSTGSIEKIDLSTAFTEKGGRRSEEIEGKPPISQGLAIQAPPPPVNRIIHMIERDY